MAEQSWSFRRPDDLAGGEVLWPHELSGIFDVSELIGQFRISRTGWDLPPGWRRRTIGGWSLSHHDALPVNEISASGEALGWILGQPILPSGDLLTCDLALPLESGTVDVTSIEAFIEELGGRFVVVLAGIAPRIYLDGSGSMGVVFSADQAIVASSMYLIPYSDPDDDRLALVEGPGEFRYDPHLFFGLTVRSSVDWLPPNHYLDLEAWRVVRHWPKGSIPIASEIGETVAFIADRLARNIRAVVASGRTQMSLTAGKDTRVLLACARDVLDGIQLVTHAIPDHAGRTDVDVARHLAHVMRLRHSVIHMSAASRSDVQRLLYRTGCVAASAARCQIAVNAMSAMDASMPYIAGTGAEIDRMPLYIDIPKDLKRFTIESFLELRGYPAWPETIERGARWLDDLPVDNPHTVYDFRALEMRFGGWGGALPYGYPNAARFFFYPFGDRKVVHALMSLPVAYRRADGVTRDVIASRWPELAESPFNDPRYGPYGWYRATRTLAKRILKR